MRIITKIVLAAAAVLSIGMAGKSATAMTVATPAAISAATDAALLRHAAHQGHHYGFHTRTSLWLVSSSWLLIFGLNFSERGGEP